MDQISNYFRKQRELYKYFGYTEDWCIFPMVDEREAYWHIDGSEVVYSYREKDIYNYIKDENYDGDFYVHTIIQPFLPTGIYPGKDYTAIIVDTDTDHNRLMQVFTNSKEVKNGN